MSRNPGGLSPENWNQINAVQAEITRWASKQFPHRTDHHAIYKLMVEEIPELATHVKEHGTQGIGPELADCFILLMDLASLWGVDLAQAIRAKMEINYSRSWVMGANGIMQHVPVQDDSQADRTCTGIECPKCQCRQIETAAVTSIYQYHCQLCDHYFDDDIPF